MPDPTLLRTAAEYRAADIRELRAFDAFMASDGPRSAIETAGYARAVAKGSLLSAGAFGLEDALFEEMCLRRAGCSCGPTGWRPGRMCEHKRAAIDIRSRAVREALAEAEVLARG
jgi:hypothetical protein